MVLKFISTIPGGTSVKTDGGMEIKLSTRSLVGAVDD